MAIQPMVPDGADKRYEGPDPYNWGAIAAELKRQEDVRKWEEAVARNARTHVNASAKVNQAAAPTAPAAPTKSAKQLLDEFRAANNGALPPGMTPAQAALIDAGIDIQAMAGANPLQGNALQIIQQQLLGVPAEYDAAKAQITNDYNRLTGDVETAGADFMKNLYGNVVDPNDPNAQAFAASPAFAEYANNLGRIQETGDVNEATDLAWFTKNQQAQQQYLQSLITGVAAGTIPIGDAASGGGGGGGGGRGGRGGGGGSGDFGGIGPNKGTLASSEAASEKTSQDEKYDWPNMMPTIFAASDAMGGTPDEMAERRQLITMKVLGYGDDPTEVSKAAVPEITQSEKAYKGLLEQQAAHKNYLSNRDTIIRNFFDEYMARQGLKYDPELDDKGNKKKTKIYDDPEGHGRTQLEGFGGADAAGLQLENTIVPWLEAQAAADQEAASGRRNRGLLGMPLSLKQAAANSLFTPVRNAYEGYGFKTFVDAQKADKLAQANSIIKEPFDISPFANVYVPDPDKEIVDSARQDVQVMQALGSALPNISTIMGPQVTGLSHSLDYTSADKYTNTAKLSGTAADRAASAIGANPRESYGSGENIGSWADPAEAIKNRMGVPTGHLGGYAGPTQSFNIDSSPIPPPPVGVTNPEETPAEMLRNAAAQYLGGGRGLGNFGGNEEKATILTPPKPKPAVAPVQQGSRPFIGPKKPPAKATAPKKPDVKTKSFDPLGGLFGLFERESDYNPPSKPLPKAKPAIAPAPKKTAAAPVKKAVAKKALPSYKGAMGPRKK